MTNPNPMLVDMLSNLEFIETQEDGSYAACVTTLNLKMPRTDKYFAYQMMSYRQTLTAVVEEAVQLYNRSVRNKLQITQPYNVGEVYEQTHELVEQICAGEHKYSKDLITPQQVEDSMLYKLDIAAPYPGVLLQLMVGVHYENNGKMNWAMMITPVNRKAVTIDGVYRHISTPVDPDDNILIFQK